MTVYFGSQREVEPSTCLSVESRLGIRIKLSVCPLPRLGRFRSVPINGPHDLILNTPFVAGNVCAEPQGKYLVAALGGHPVT